MSARLRQILILGFALAAVPAWSAPVPAPQKEAAKPAASAIEKANPNEADDEGDSLGVFGLTGFQPPRDEDEVDRDLAAGIVAGIPDEKPVVSEATETPNELTDQLNN